jgi:hypothetical protein
MSVDTQAKKARAGRAGQAIKQSKASRVRSTFTSLVQTVMLFGQGVLIFKMTMPHALDHEQALECSAQPSKGALGLQKGIGLCVQRGAAALDSGRPAGSLSSKLQRRVLRKVQLLESTHLCCTLFESAAALHSQSIMSEGHPDSMIVANTFRSGPNACSLGANTNARCQLKTLQSFTGRCASKWQVLGMKLHVERASRV